MPENPQIDYVQTDGSGRLDGGSGSVAELLLNNGMNPQGLRSNATLRKDEWIELDQAIITPARERLIGVADLVSNNLTYNLRNAMGTLVLQHETVSEFTAAEVTMDAITRPQQDRQLFELVSTPIPIVHKDFRISVRNLEASRRNGQPLDVTQAQEASRQVAETVEDMLFNGLGTRDTLGFGSLTAQLFGYTNRTNRNTVTLAQDWDASGKTGTEILNDVLDMIQAAHDDRMFGPYMLYVPTNFYIPLLEDFKADSDKTIIQRLKEIPQIIDIKPADKLTDSNVVLVQMTSTNVDMIMGQQPTVVQWESEGGMMLNFKVMAIMVPRIKLDAGNRSGVTHLS